MSEKTDKQTLTADTISDTAEQKKKLKRTVNISIQKRNLEEINDILNMWDYEGLNASREICKAILFKYSLENNPYLQTLLSTLNLIKSNLKSKNLNENDLETASMIALKNIVSIKIDAQELTNFLENDDYFNLDSNNTPIIDTLENIPSKKSNEIAFDKDASIKSEPYEEEKNTQPLVSVNSEESQPTTKKTEDKILKWSIPESATVNTHESSKSKDNSSYDEDLLNSKFGAFQYNSF